MIKVDSTGRIFIDGEKSNFYVHEFVTPETFKKWGARSLRYIEEAVIRGAQVLRDASGLSITICDYNGGGPYRDSGTRILESYQRMYSSKSKEAQLQKYLKTYSMHKFGGAADLKIGKMTSHEMEKLVRDNEEELLRVGIRRIENPDKTKGKNRDWLHIDTGNTGKPYIVQVNP